MEEYRAGGGTVRPSAVWQRVLHQAEQRMAAGGHAVLAIDGRCGSGKSTLSRLLAERFSCRVFHMDDFYLPPERRAAGWETTPCANMDLERFRHEVLAPASRGQCVRYRPYSCREGRFAETQTIPPQPLTVVEGSYAMHPLLRPFYDFSVFLTCSPQEQERRLLAREGTRYPAFRQRWIPLEEAYFRDFAVAQSCDMTVDTDAPAGADEPRL